MRRHVGARRTRGDRGATSVEFALMLPVALLLIGSIVVLALHMTYAALADHAARVGLKKAVIRTSAGYPTDAAVRTTVDGLFGSDLLGGPQSLTVTRQDGIPAQGDTVRVTVVYQVPAVSKAAALVPDAPIFDGVRAGMERLAVIRRVAEGRSE
jgi:Flp pilus assembly protein TadG